MPNPTLHVCTTCRVGRELAPGETPPGKLFHDALAAAAPGLDLREVVCLSSCDHGCARGDLGARQMDLCAGPAQRGADPDLLTYAASYAASKTGTVLPSKRPASLARMILARVPDLAPLETATEQAA